MHTGSRVWPDLGKNRRHRHRTKLGKGSCSYWAVQIVCLDGDFSLLLHTCLLRMIFVVHLTSTGIHHPQDAAWVWVGQGESFAVCPCISAFPSSPTQRSKPEPSDMNGAVISDPTVSWDTWILWILPKYPTPRAWALVVVLHGFHLLNGLDWPS